MIGLKKAVGLSLAREVRLAISAGDKPTSDILSRLTEVMHLQHIDNPTFEIVLVSNGSHFETEAERKNCAKENAPFSCEFFKSSLLTINPSINKDMAVCEIGEQIIGSNFSFQVLCISILIGLLAMNREGMLIHGALAVKDGCGVILAGLSGVGKTTASNRLPKPWRSLSDDMTVIVRDSKGVYWAHPLPSHSRFANGQDGIWDVQDCVPLKGIFFLRQSKNDSTRPLIAPDAVTLIVSSAGQAMIQLLNDRFNRVDQKTRRTLYKQLFNDSCTMCRSVPAYLLDISLHGEFWHEIDRALSGYST